MKIIKTSQLTLDRSDVDNDRRQKVLDTLRQYNNEIGSLIPHLKTLFHDTHFDETVMDYWESTLSEGNKNITEFINMVSETWGINEKDNNVVGDQIDAYQNYVNTLLEKNPHDPMIRLYEDKIYDLIGGDKL
jgi:hypothetical protein